MQTKSAVPIFDCFFARWMRAVISMAIIGVLVSGCTESKLQGPTAPAVTRSEPWSYGTDDGELIHTDHYNIYTTIPDHELRQRLADVMEGALGEYQRVAPGVPLTDRPMDCYFFRNREEWVDYTRRHTGIDAYIYLQIGRGGYTRGDWYAGYYLGSPAATMSVAAHEGWHQFAYRHFKGRLPPFLEEGIATMFEDITWSDDLPRWNLSINRSRLQSLREAVEGKYLYPLPDLAMKHAGNVVAEADNHTAAFYGESWAFASFLWTADNAKYRPILRRMLSDIADGTVYDPSGSHQNKLAPWSPAAVKPLLEHYMGMSLEALDGEYQKYIQKVAFDDYASQWN
jgi:hypothetical protein